MMIFVQS